jgi:hypothetical protein
MVGAQVRGDIHDQILPTYLRSRWSSRPDPRLDSTYLRTRRGSRPGSRSRSYLSTLTAGLALSSGLLSYLRRGRGSRVYIYVGIHEHSGDGAQVHIWVHTYGGGTGAGPRRRCRYAITADAQMHDHDENVDTRSRRRRRCAITADAQINHDRRKYTTTTRVCRYNICSGLCWAKSQRRAKPTKEMLREFNITCVAMVLTRLRYLCGKARPLIREYSHASSWPNDTASPIA